MAIQLALTISAIVSIIAGLLILFWPKLLRIIVGIYLLIVGILGLFNIAL
jgi:uncharacterized membrane protein HdeD (DUF308 family)